MQGNLSFTKPPKLFSFSVDKELCETDLLFPSLSLFRDVR